ncbi:MAG TPA: hypothetical protein PKM43_20785 [Verrucomicrobiota bacterium]|nr:hypothetical protein [Verrucomicrobiota bacterium]
MHREERLGDTAILVDRVTVLVCRPVSVCCTGSNANLATGHHRKWAILIITSTTQPYDGTAYHVLVIKR